MARKRSNINALAQLLGAAATPIYALDRHRRIIYCNAALTAWLNVQPRDLMGATCDYHSGMPVDPAAVATNRLCPPPEAFRGEACQAVLIVPRPGGGVQRRRVQFVPIGLVDDSLSEGVLAVVDPRESAEPGGTWPQRREPAAWHTQLREVLSSLAPPYRLAPLVGSHPAIARVRELIRLAAASDFRTLVVGPPGSGREHVARAIHGGSLRDGGAPLAPLACHLLDAELLEQTVTSFIASCAELQLEQPPALLLLEIDQLASDAQRALAGLLSIGELQLRTVATARRRLIEMAATGDFRQDLAFSLSTVEISLPPLADRREDIGLLAQFFLEKRNAAGGKQLSGFSRDAFERLLAYRWPGNVGELAEVIEESWPRAAGPQLRARDLPPRLEWAARAAARPTPEEPIELDQLLGEVEREALQRAMRQARGKKARAARLLGITPARLLRRLAHFGLAAEAPPNTPPADST